MTIGEALKHFRLSLGLTQTEMASGLLSESYYSRVERDKHEIDAKTLIELLQKRNISCSSFFTYMEQQDIFPEKYYDFSRKMLLAVNMQDMTKLLEYREFARKNNYPLWLIDAANRYISFLQFSNKGVDQGTKNRLKRKLGDGSWNFYKFIDLANGIYVLNFEETYQIVQMAYQGYKKIKFLDILSEQSAGNVAVNFLNRCYHENVDSQYATSSLQFLKEMRVNPVNFFFKIFYAYYNALLNNDSDKVDNIVETLKISGLYSSAKDTYELYLKRK